MVVETVVEVLSVPEPTDPHATKTIEMRMTDSRVLAFKQADLPNTLGVGFDTEWVGCNPLETETQRNGCKGKYDDERDCYPVQIPLNHCRTRGSRPNATPEHI